MNSVKRSDALLPRVGSVAVHLQGEAYRAMAQPLLYHLALRLRAEASRASAKENANLMDSPAYVVGGTRCSL